MRPVLWEVQRHGETVRHTTLAETAFEACAKRGLTLSEATVERTPMLGTSRTPVVPVKHRWRALNRGIHAEHPNEDLSSCSTLLLTTQ